MAPIQRNLRMTLPLIALLATLLTGCAGYRPVPEDTPAAVIVQPINPVRMSPDRQARVLGVVLGGMRFPVTGKAESCEFLPDVAGETVGVAAVAQLAQMGDRRAIGDKAARGIAEHGLFFGEDECHRQFSV